MTRRVPILIAVIALIAATIVWFARRARNDPMAPRHYLEPNDIDNNGDWHGNSRP